MTDRPADLLTRFRGQFPAQPTSARQVVSAMSAPGCGRRSVLDAARVHTGKLANLLSGTSDQQSPFVMSRAAQFERTVTRDGLATVIALAREHLDLDLADIRQVDLSSAKVREEHRLRGADAVTARRLLLTRQRLRSMLDGSDDINLLRNAITEIGVHGRTTLLEHDVLALASGGRLHLLVIRSYQAIDGRPDATKVSATLAEAAVHLLSLQETVATIDALPSSVSDRVLLILPANLTFAAVGRVYDARHAVARLQRQLSHGGDPELILTGSGGERTLPALPPDDAPECDRRKAQDAAAEAVAALPPAFGDGCVTCPMFRFCRDEAQRHHAIARLGNDVANACGEVATVSDALDLAEGRRQPRTDAEAAVAGELRRAALAERLLLAEG